LGRLYVSTRNSCARSTQLFVDAYFLRRVSKTEKNGTCAKAISELIQHEVDHLNGVLLTDRMLPEWGIVARAMRNQARPITQSLETARPPNLS
jgi:peptide deformylase